MYDTFDTIIVGPFDISKEDAGDLSAYDFNLSVEQINRARNIIYVGPFGEVIFLKIKEIAMFKEQNKLLFP